MEQNNLKNQIHEFYAKKSLSEDRLNLLLRLQEKATPIPVKTNLMVGKRGLLIAVAACFLGFLAYKTTLQPVNLPYSVAKEVAYNHNKLKDLEISTSSYRDIQSKLNKLDFSIISSKLISKAHQLLGGRYCSIQGVLAAQLRYQNTSSRSLMTVYQVPFHKKYHKVFEKPFTTQVNGVEIKIWNEMGLLLATAKSSI